MTTSNAMWREVTTEWAKLKRSGMAYELYPNGFEQFREEFLNMNDKTVVCSHCKENIVVESGLLSFTCPVCNTQIHSQLDNPISPRHYFLWDNKEAIDIIKNTLTQEEYEGYLKGNILKYRLRAPYKNKEEDIKKAERYQEWLSSL